MPTLGQVEDAILRIEEFEVAFTHASGRDARSNKTGFIPYPFKYRLNPELTVADWIRQRAEPYYGEHGYRIVVKYADGTPAHGGTKLKQVRADYR
jgi:hypothetical protein